MTFKDLLEQFSFDEIAPAFKTLWQRNAPEQAARLDMEGWREIYHSIQEIKPVHSLTISVWDIVGRVVCR